MDGLDREVLKDMVRWLDAGQEVYLCTVVSTWGSAPRPQGALLAIAMDGATSGSVSGGCVEDDLIERALGERLARDGPEIVTYGVTREQAGHFGLPCGGRLDILVERIRTAGQSRRLLEALEARELLARRLCLDTGEVSLHPARPDEAFVFDGRIVSKVFGPQWQLLIIGAGHMSRPLAQMAQALDYRVIVCDPREDYVDAWDVQGTELVRAMPDEVVKAHAEDPQTAVVALTHEPKLDDMALLEALSSRSFYVGAIGSQANNARRRERLQTLGLSPEAVQRLHGPVGLPIGSRTPPEVAVSILAEITALRRGAGVPARKTDSPAGWARAARSAIPG